MNKEDQIKRIRQFRDSLKKYMEVCKEFWVARHEYRDVEASTVKKEEEMRESLTENWGRLEQLFNKIGAPNISYTPATGIRRPIFDDALSPDFEGGVKGDALQGAIAAATKALGLLDALSEAQYKGISRSTPIIFIGHSFKEEHRAMVEKAKEFIGTFPVSVTTGEKPTLTGVTEGVPAKVKSLIDDADLVVAILTRDEALANSKMGPSKWVSDEIAYAIGKGKTIFRMVENGVEYKSAISGDVEYIAFDETDLSAAFLKLSELLNSFLSK
jgi:hypothetical protein